MARDWWESDEGGAKDESRRTRALYGDTGCLSPKDASTDLPICQGHNKLFGCCGLQGKNLGFGCGLEGGEEVVCFVEHKKVLCNIEARETCGIVPMHGSESPEDRIHKSEVFSQIASDAPAELGSGAVPV